MKRELFALAVVLAVLVLFPATLFGYQAARTRNHGIRVIDMVARVPERGGFVPDRLQLKAGDPVRFRLTSPDVVHGFSIPGLGVNVDEIYPGKVVEVDVTPDKPGRYAFACTRWCGADHWRMRGVIEVEGTDGAALPAEQPPLFQQLGIDIDAMRHDVHTVPTGRPSAGAGAKLSVALPNDPSASSGQAPSRSFAGSGGQALADPATRRTLSPVDAFQGLRGDPANVALRDDDVWNLVAWAWLKDVKPEAMARAKTLYARDCAACHGPEGKGDGPAGKNLPGLSKMDPTMPAGPADFTNAGQMLSASDVLLQGKLLRGGMGTGMPEFGSLYTDEEQWAMIAYLRTFLFGE